MKKNKGIIVLTAIAVLMFGCVSNSPQKVLNLNQNQQSSWQPESLKNKVSFPEKLDRDKETKDLEQMSNNASKTVTPETNWPITCEVDRMTDKKSCKITRWFKESCRGTANHHLCMVEVQLHPTLGVVLVLGFQDDPTTYGQVRFGKNKMEYYKGPALVGVQAKRLLKQMKSEQSGLIVAPHWPEDSVEFDVDLSGFNKAYAEMDKAFRE